MDARTKLQSNDPSSRLQTLITSVPGQADQIRKVVVEFKPYTLRRRATEPSSIMVGKLIRLATLLALPKAKEAEFHTLRCIALVHQQLPSTRFVLAFELPMHASSCMETSPPTLAEAITSRNCVRPTLGQRFKLGRTLARTIFQLHSVDWLHKSIRSENIVFGTGPDTAEGSGVIDYSNPCLIGFEFAREENDRSTTEYDDMLSCNIYRHPDRQGPPEERFSQLHDIYSLGVVLLEIGLWRPAISFEHSYGDMGPAEISESLKEHARDRLPHYMGSEYAEAVDRCLSGELLDDANEIVGGLTLPWQDSLRLKVNLGLEANIIGKLKSDLALI